MPHIIWKQIKTVKYLISETVAQVYAKIHIEVYAKIHIDSGQYILSVSCCIVLEQIKQLLPGFHPVYI
jgi:hypothetical protein